MTQMISVPFGNTFVQRTAPAMPVQAYTTYGMLRPLKTHWRRATCEEAGCAAYLKGWVTTVDLSTELGRRQYDLITRDRERRYSVQRVTATMVKFTYGPGMPCFARSAHQMVLEREPRFIVAHGDWRGYLDRPRVHKRAEEWVEDFSIHQDKLATVLGRG